MVTLSLHFMHTALWIKTTNYLRLSSS